MTFAHSDYFAFLAFDNTDIAGGVDTFDTHDPSNNSTKTFAFAEAPKVTHIVGENGATQVYKVSLVLDRYP